VSWRTIMRDVDFMKWPAETSLGVLMPSKRLFLHQAGGTSSRKCPSLRRGVRHAGRHKAIAQYLGTPSNIRWRSPSADDWPVGFVTKYSLGNLDRPCHSGPSRPRIPILNLLKSSPAP